MSGLLYTDKNFLAYQIGLSTTQNKKAMER